MAQQTGVVNIRGKEYQTVALRVQTFREKHPNWSLTTEILSADSEVVRMKATISDDSGRVLANGHAEEYRKTSEINRTSALENCETSAIGRALAAMGLGGTEFASADEVARAISGAKGEPPKPAGLSESDITDHKAAMSACADLESLKAAHKAALAHANGDQARMLTGWATQCKAALMVSA